MVRNLGVLSVEEERCRPTERTETGKTKGHSVRSALPDTILVNSVAKFYEPHTTLWALSLILTE